ncbi:MAG: 2-oxoglutarate dehydrogenase complex dihydrolipoyllysine-residue succinyltransferase [Myxococcales bacterium]|nr:2-oxoglutarate dehydrogenase complex dihydrolipoyllysine-residue succinyltransferase [Myxococcales bacterium]
MIALRVPELGESITEAVVAKWHKAVGDEVSADEPLVTLETEKVTVEMPAPASGTLSQVLHREGETVKVGEALGQISEGAARKPRLREVPPPAALPAKEKAPAPTPVAREMAEEKMPAPTPVARRVAEERGVDTGRIRGTGPGGRVLKQDVLGAAARVSPEAVEKAPRALREERVKMTPLRRRVAERLVQAQQTAAILTTFNECDMSAVMALRREHGERFRERHGVKLGLMSFFVRAAVEGLRAFPQLNAEIDGDEVVFKRYYDIGVAVAGSRGLVVPVLRDADRLGMAELERRISVLAERARTDKLRLDDLRGGTFTITNGGVFGSMLSTPILNPPQTGILGMHAIADRPVAREGQVVIRPVMYLALSYDHRLVDGREAVLFLVRVKECIESPARLLLEV